MFFSSEFATYLEFALSFGFTFAVAFGVLYISKVFGEPEGKTPKRVNILLAVIISLFASFSEAYVNFLFQWIFYLIAIFMIVFVVLIFKNLFYSEKRDEEKTVSWPMFVSIAVLFLVFLGSYQYMPLPSGQIISSQDVALVIGIAFIVLILVVGSRKNLNNTWENQQTTKLKKLANQARTAKLQLS